MKKILFWIFSAMLAIGGSVSATAQAPAQKVAGAPRAIATVATPAPAKQLVQRFKFGTARTAAVASPFRQAVNGTVAPARTIARAEATAIPEMNGLVVYADSWEAAQVASPYYGTLPRTAGAAFTELFPLELEGTVYSAIRQDDVLYTSELVDVMGFFQMYYFNSYDAETGERLTTYNSETPEVIMMGMAQDPTTGLVYSAGFNNEGNGLWLSTLTLGGEQPVINNVADINLSLSSMSFDSNGQLYGIAGASDQDNNIVDSYLVKIDKTNGSYEVIGDATGIVPQYLSGGCIDPATNTYYFHQSTDAGGNLYAIDLTTGVPTLLMAFPDGEEVVGIQMAPVVLPGTPGKPENLTATFSEGSLSGTVAFDAPAVEGATTLTYTVYANADEVATGTVAPGAHAEAAVTVAAAGQYTFSVKLANGELVGSSAKIAAFVGNGVPAAPEAVAAEYSNGTMTVTWAAVTTSADGGYIDPAAVTYDVVRQPDGVTVATDLTATTFSEELAVPDHQVRYSYDVTAKYAGAVSAAGSSNGVALGELLPPYSNDFADEARFAEMTVLDANADGSTWSFDAGVARYRYNSDNAGDDWLWTPVLTVEPGLTYNLTFKARGGSSAFTERLEVYAGDAADVAAMTTVVMESTIFESSSYTEYSFLVDAPASGKLAIGFHAISDADQYYIYLDDVEIGEGVSNKAPSAPTDIVLTPDPNGAYSVAVSCKAPATTLAGEALTGNVDMVIMRGETLVFDGSVAAGAAINVNDEIAGMTEGGDVTYMFMGANADGAGTVVSQTVYVGVDYPAAPELVTLTESTVGTATITWTPVTTNANGNAISPSLVKYNVYEFDGTSRLLVGENIEGTTFSHQPFEEGMQDFMMYAVFAVTERGEGEGQVSNMEPIGTPYEGMIESFANTTLNHPFAMHRLNGSTIRWNLYNDESLGIPSQDGDNGFIGSNGRYLEESSALVFPKVSLAGLVNPGFSFYTFNIVGENGEADENVIDVQVREAGTTEWTSLLSNTVVGIVGEGVEGWGKATVSLVAYTGKTVQLRVITTIGGFAYTLLDNFKIASQLGKDLKAHTIAAPGRVPAGMDYQVQVKVANEGTLEAESYNVELYADGQLVETQTGSNLAAGTTAAHNFNANMHVLATEPIAYHAVVVFEGDENPDNNTLEAVTVTPKVSNLPAVSDLNGAEVAEGVKLTWSEPNLESVPETKTEGFEEATAFAHEFEGWTFVDRDGGAVGGFQNVDVPGITPGTTTGSFFVFEQSDAYPQFNLTFTPHAGTKYLACLFNYDDSQIDDWAISPELTGNAQTISFYARSYSPSYPELISVYYSTSSANIEDFVAVEGMTDITVPAGGENRDWTLYEASLPAGAKYFAIRSHAAGSFMLMLDDVTFETAGSTASLSIVGYDVYRNGVKINAETSGETEYIDATPLENAEYQVVVKYNKGLSAGSNAVTVAYSGIEGIGAGNITIATARQAIVVRGAEGQQIVVNAVDGRTIFAGEGSATTRVAVASGVYLVKAGNKIAKVIVR